MKTRNSVSFIVDSGLPGSLLVLNAYYARDLHHVYLLRKNLHNLIFLQPFSNHEASHLPYRGRIVQQTLLELRNICQPFKRMSLQIDFLL